MAGPQITGKVRRAFLEAALKKMIYLQLAESKVFMNCFLKNLNFPSFTHKSDIDKKKPCMVINEG